MPAHRERGRPPYPDLLTPAEWEVLDWLRHGATRREIARRRGTSPDAVRYHVRNISGKLGVAGSTELRLWPGYPLTSPLSRRNDPVGSAATGVRLGAIGQISLSIRDVERAERFYRDTLGLPHLFTFGDLTFFDCAGTRLYMHCRDDADWQPSSILYFTVDDIAAAYDQLTGRGVAFSGAPHLIHRHDDGTEEWMAFFEDTEGNTLALMSRVPPSPNTTTR
jgi:DNA-binding CsgD family transcriptional regulator/catechol 2,3-dioxygenase-like lactoylglutathione lyase family enzyme